MKNLLIISLLVFTNNLFSQSNYTFINAAWGCETINSCDTSNRENLSELYWGESVLSVCISQNEQYISKNFHVYEQNDLSGAYTLDILIQTLEGYTIHLSGGYIQGKSFINSVEFYYAGEKVGYLNYPIL